MTNLLGDDVQIVGGGGGGGEGWDRVGGGDRVEGGGRQG